MFQTLFSDGLSSSTGTTLPDSIREIAGLLQTSGICSDRNLERKLFADFVDIALLDKPEITKDISLVHVLSGRFTCLGSKIDTPDVIDSKDDIDRINCGISIARTVAEMRVGKGAPQMKMVDYQIYGPMILYNGTPQHNIDLRLALTTGLINNYPVANFIIQELPLDQQNSKGHFLAMKDAERYTSGEIAIVTHAYHGPRISRMVGECSPLNPLPRADKIKLFLVDCEFSSLDSQGNILGEFRRIVNYISKGDLSTERSTNVFITRG